MDELDPLESFELCFPGAVTGVTEICCPHCDTLSTLSVEDPMGAYSCRCDQCGKQFVADLSTGTVHWEVEE